MIKYHYNYNILYYVIDTVAVIFYSSADGIQWN